MAVNTLVQLLDKSGQVAAEDATIRQAIYAAIARSPVLNAIPWMGVSVSGSYSFNQVDRAALTRTAKNVSHYTVTGSVRDTTVLAAQDLGTTVENLIINGVIASSFDGINALTLGSASGAASSGYTSPDQQTISMGANGSTLTLAKLDELILFTQQRTGVKPSLLIMAPRSWGTVSALARNAANPVTDSFDKLGRFAPYYNGIPIVSSWSVSMTETQGSNTDCSRIFCVTTGENYLHGIHDLSALYGVEEISSTQYQMKLALALKDANCVTKLVGVRP